MMKNKFLILAYPGSGKTYLAENYQNVADLEFQHFRWDYGEYKNLPLEKLKGGVNLRTEKPNWLENFYEHIMGTFEKYPIILVPMSTSVMKLLDRISSQGIKVVFAIHNPEAFEELIETYKQRGNSAEFVKSRKEDFHKFYEITQETTYDKIFINKGEHLSDALLKLKITLERGKGYKNYF